MLLYLLVSCPLSHMLIMYLLHRKHDMMQQRRDQTHWSWILSVQMAIFASASFIYIRKKKKTQLYQSMFVCLSCIVKICTNSICGDWRVMCRDQNASEHEVELNAIFFGLILPVYLSLNPSSCISFPHPPSVIMVIVD